MRLAPMCKKALIVDGRKAIVGELFNTACALLGGQGSNCNAISGNGTTGVYGAVSGCDAGSCLIQITIFTNH